MEKKILDQAAIIDCMGGEQQSKTGLVIAIVLLCTVILSPLGIVVLLGREDQKKRIRTLKNRLYRLQSDSVFQKYMQRSTDSYDIPCVNLNNYGTLELSGFPSAVYDQLKPGDKLYLLQNAKGKVWHIFNCHEWELDETSFHRDGKYFYPNPNSDYATEMPAPIEKTVNEEMPPQLLLAKKRLLLGLALLPVSLFAALALFVSAMGTGILGALGAVVLGAIFTGIAVFMLRAQSTKHSKDDTAQKAYRTKHRWYAFGAFVLSGVYFLLTFFICGSSIILALAK